ncbi:MAG: succinate dehydrogenase, cytochrome b556 subunit [Ottowia sp.]|nr:succinate dehydrogenase, cytochrome b556 subunit [Ottowia sp.]
MGHDVKKERPVFRNIHVTQLMAYRLPWAGKVSILHRISGLLLFLMLPVVLYIFELSLTSELSYSHFTDLLAGTIAKVMVSVLVWAYLHHFCAGLRYLLLDVHIGVARLTAQQSAIAVLFTSLVLTALFVARLFNFF